jgi:hypothetical protein
MYDGGRRSHTRCFGSGTRAEERIRTGDAGKRKIVPGSLPILHNLRKLGFIDIYEQAGF